MYMYIIESIPALIILSAGILIGIRVYWRWNEGKAKYEKLKEEAGKCYRCDNYSVRYETGSRREEDYRRN